ncbi:pathogen-associated molecular patterns-induced protein A70-like [Impatiens glandulifera]|uniref:pathogen-associated molecular patterns-induced protein A70-like n=1 Tax=Impatiens glandulifera TaxID=253017 RepID=UPI001FB0D3D5|nr:pathogen-associated molecular patterns-induced protein A70-like [Impatiens glandulifera]
MFEDSISFIPSIWTAANSWFTPTVFFILLNIVIGTIAITSNLSHRHQQQQQQSKQDLNLQQNPLFRSPSVLQRLRSINFYPYKYHDPEPSPYHFSPSYVSDDSNSPLHQTSDKLQTPPTEPHHVFQQTHLEEETEEQDDEEEEAKSMDEVYSQLTNRHVTRTRSDTEPASGEVPTKLPAKMRKSASMKSAFGHFNKDDAAAVVEARRPATVRESKTRLGDADEEVDAKADDFINKFKQQLKLQRLDSILRYKEMIGRGTPSN